MNLLRIDSSPMGGAAISRRLTDEFVRRWLAANPGGSVSVRDLATIAIPLVDAEWVSAQYTRQESRTHRQNELLDLSTKLVSELLDADECVIGMPMHNWGPSAGFKLWPDKLRAATGRETRYVHYCGWPGVLPAIIQRIKESLSAMAANLVRFSWQQECTRPPRRRHQGNQQRQIDRAAFLAHHNESIDALFRTAADHQPASDPSGSPGPHA